MTDPDDRRFASPGGGGLEDLGREAQASLVLIVVTLAVVLTITIVGFAVS